MPNIVALDVGHKRIGVAVADTNVRIAIPYDTIPVDGHEIEKILELAVGQDAKKIVVGYPRNQSGEPTAQTDAVEQFAKRLGDSVEIVFQDESLTSVIAEDRLEQQKRAYDKSEIDSEAAAIILQDYLEQVYVAA